MTSPGPMAPMAPLVPLFAPYCGGLAQQALLQEALILLGQGAFQGERPLAGGKGHRYQLLWQGESAPLEVLRCELAFPDNDQPDYHFALPAHQLVAWLMQRQGNDLPQAFWSWLLVGQVAEGSA